MMKMKLVAFDEGIQFEINSFNSCIIHRDAFPADLFFTLEVYSEICHYERDKQSFWEKALSAQTYYRHQNC